MRTGIVSDTHGDPSAWEKAVGTLGEVDLMIHAGDVLYHGVFNPILDSYDPRRLVEIMNSFAAPMVHARGNCDSEVDQLALNNHILSDFAFASVEGSAVLVTHGHRHSDEELSEMGGRAGVRLIVRGHTHVPEIREVNGLLIVNPGSPSLPKGEGRIPTAGLLEDGKVTILDIENGERLLEGRLRR